MSKVKYCLPLIVESIEEAKDVISSHVQEYDYFELWLDYLSDYSREEIETLCSQYQDRLILLFRRQYLETIQLPLVERLEVIKIASKYGSYIDLDVRAQTEELKAFGGDEKKQNLLLSYHNYDGTPEDEVLEKILETMSVYNPAIYKVACMCQSRSDALRLMALQRKLQITGYRSIVSGMGEKGTITRIFAPLWGSEMSYAPQTRGKASAAGQLTRSELDTVFKIIETL